MSQAGSFFDGTLLIDIETLTGNSGGPVGPTLGNVNILGSGVVDVAGNPGTSTLTITVSGTLAEDFVTDAGTATPVLNALNILGGEVINTSGAGSTVTINLDRGTDGQVLIAATGAPTAYASLTSVGGSVTFTPGANTLNLEAVSTAMAWVEVLVVGPTGLSVNTGYVTNNAGLVQLTLPAVAAFGSIVRISGKGSGGWQLLQNIGQTIFFGSFTTTPGVGGSLSSTQQKDAVELVCVTANNDWNVMSVIGNLTVV